MGMKEARLSAGKTVLEVSRALCVSPQAVYQWESGQTNPSSTKLIRLAELYGCLVDNLLDCGDNCIPANCKEEI